MCLSHAWCSNHNLWPAACSNRLCRCHTAATDEAIYTKLVVKKPGLNMDYVSGLCGGASL